MEEVISSESHSNIPSFAEPQSSDVCLNENIVPNIASDPVNDPDSLQQESECNLVPDQVSSSSESFSGSLKHNLPSINHQSVLIPNMEPYLEEGSLDGSPKQCEDLSPPNGKVNTHVHPLDKPSEMNLTEQVENPTIFQDDKVRIENVEEPVPELTSAKEEENESISNNTEVPTQENNVNEGPCTNQEQPIAEAGERFPEHAIPNQSCAVVNKDQIFVNEASGDQIYLLDSSYSEQRQDFQSNLQENPNPSLETTENSDSNSVKEQLGTVASSLHTENTISTITDNINQKNSENVPELKSEALKTETAELHPESSNLFEKEAFAEKTVNEYPFNCGNEGTDCCSANTLPQNDKNVAAVDQELGMTKVEDYPEVEKTDLNCDNLSGTLPLTASQYVHYGQEESNCQQEVTPAVCEADSSAAYVGGEIAMGSQSVYVVDDGMALNSIPQTGSMTPYHNPENSMLVEMAPLSTDESYGNPHTQVISRFIK